MLKAHAGEKSLRPDPYMTNVKKDDSSHGNGKDFFEMFMNNAAKHDTSSLQNNDFQLTPEKISADNNAPVNESASSHESAAESRESRTKEDKSESIKKDNTSSAETQIISAAHHRDVPAAAHKRNENDNADKSSKIITAAGKLLDAMKKNQTRQITQPQKNEINKLITDLREFEKQLPAKSETAKKIAAVTSRLEDLLKSKDTKSLPVAAEFEIKKLLTIIKSSPIESDPKAQLASLVETRDPKKNADHTRAKSENVIVDGVQSRKEITKEQNSGQNEFSFSRETKMRDPANITHNVQRFEARSVFKDQLDTLVNNAKVTVQDTKNATLSMRMYPEKLGSVTVNLGLENGTLTGRFLVDSNEARETLIGALGDVRTLLENEGISLGAFHVNVRDQSHERRSDFKDEFKTNIRVTDAEISEEYRSMQKLTHDGAVDLIG